MDVLATIGSGGVALLMVYVISLAWNAVPVVFVFITKSWKERFKALAGWAVVSALVFTALTGVAGLDLSGMIMTLLGLLLTYLLVGGIVLVVADLISEPIARLIERKT